MEPKGPSTRRAVASPYTSYTYITKDSGEREQLAGGMVRDTTEGKVSFSLIFKGPLLRRWAELLTRGATKYGRHNWLLGVHSDSGPAREETRERFLDSAARHFVQWLEGDRTEDHAAAVIFNMNGYEAMRDEDLERLEKDKTNAG